MCGRFVLSSPVSIIAEEFNAEHSLFDLEPSYNIAPTHKIVIVQKEGVNKLIQCRWGFIPAWAKDPKIGYKMINARSETIAEKPAFRSAFKNQRCLIVADGFFEWQREGKTKKPVYIKLKSDKAFGFAGLYSVWTSPEGEKACTCTIITTEANELLEPVHDRMPAIIPKEKYDIWLDPNVQDKDSLLTLLKPYNYPDIEAFYVSSKVNSPAYNSKDNIEPESYL
jgi:putative SOS response-associated peptidase YedK